MRHLPERDRKLYAGKNRLNTISENRKIENRTFSRLFQENKPNLKLCSLVALKQQSFILHAMLSV